jgi:hypothetical protein
MLSPIVRRGTRLALSGWYRAFHRDLRDPARSQSRLLGQLIARIARTDYGRSLGIRPGDSYREFAEKAPIVEYEAIEPWIARQAASSDAIVTPDPIVVYEETSGSSGPRKLVPYTDALLASFDRFFRLWTCDLLAHGPRLQTGKTLASVSPAVRDGGVTPSGVPIGFDDDTRYLSRLSRWLFGSRFIPSPGALGSDDLSLFLRVLATRALAERDLEVIFFWSPSYLTSILDWVADHREQVLTDLERGAIEAGRLVTAVTPRRDLQSVLAGDRPIDWQQVWPRLKLLSCWTDGSAGLFVKRLERELPGVWIQGKGLLATEGPITVPLCRSPAPVPLLGEVFLEFESDDGEVYRLHEIEPGREYEVILSQKGGLTRYRMNDRVRVTGTYHQTPCLRFLGRNSCVTDLAGEKLNERFVREAILRAYGDGDGSMDGDDFAYLVPAVRADGLSGYVCVTDGARGGLSLTSALERELSAALERELSRAFQYRNARVLGQLAPVRTIVRSDAKVRYTRHFLARGMKWGDMKYDTLIGAVDEAELAELTR